MARANVMMPPSTTLMLVVTFMLSVHIASVQNTSTDVTTVISSNNASENNDTTVTSSYNASESNNTTVTSSYNASENTNTTVTSSYNASENNDTTEASSPHASESPGTNDTNVTSSYNTSESTGTDDTTVTSSYNTSESTGTDDTAVTSSYNTSESTGTDDTTVTSSYNTSESTGTDDTTVTSSYNTSESTGTDDTTVTSSYNTSESTGTDDTTVTSSYNTSESTGTDDTAVTSSYNTSESTGTDDTTVTSSYNTSESTGTDDTTVTSSYNTSESTGTDDTTVTSLNAASESNDIIETSSSNASENTDANDSSVTSSYDAAEMTSTDVSTVESTNTTGYVGNTTPSSDNNSTADNITSADSNGSTNGTTDTSESITTASTSSSNATLTTTTTTPSTTTEIQFGQNCSSSGGKCASDLICNNSTNKCDCPSDKYYNSSTNSCLQKKSLGVPCGTTVQECINNLTCILNMCGCSDGYYYSTSGYCEQKKNQGGPCTTVSECINNLTCESDKCGCGNGLYYQTSTSSCKPKKNQGVVCGTTDPECISNLICVNPGLTCGCNDSFYYQQSSNSCKQKLDHGVACQSSDKDQCRVTNTVCISYPPSSTTKCLCDSHYYWTDNNSCNLQSILNINLTVADGDRRTRNITFHWNDLSGRSDVNYIIKWNVSNSLDANKDGVTVVGLDPGTSYIFYVVTSLPADGNYQVIETQTQTAVWTRPDTPGEVIPGGVKRIDNSTYEVMFGPSSGRVNLYRMDVYLAGNFTETQINTSTVLYFKKLEPAKTYNYSLWSTNGNSDNSVPVNSTFTTGPEESGPVDGLISTGVQSDKANVTWKPPQNPRGNITGYVVEVALQDSTHCLYYFKIPCHNCLPLPDNISNSSCNLMNATITDNGTLYNLELPNLKPYKNYTVKVHAVNEIGLGQLTTLTFQTSASAPKDILNVTVNSVRNESSLNVDLIITWTPGEQTGPTNYYISAQAENDNENISPLTETVTGYINNSTVIYNVLANWVYKISVLAQTDNKNSSEKFELHKTVENVPGPVQNLNVKQDSTIANILTLTFECPEIKRRNGIIKMFMINQTLLNPQENEEKENKYNVSASVGEPCNSGYEIKPPSIIVERNYSFTVMTVNNKYTGGLSNESIFYVPSKAPQPAMLKELLDVDSLVKKKESSNEQTKIKTDVCSTCLTDDRWGRVVKVGLIVCVKGRANCTETGRKKRSTDQLFEQLTSWTAAKQQDFKVAYRTTPDNWIPPPASGNKYSPFVVGENTSCADASTQDYCNGPLLAGQEFIIRVIMCTTAGCTIYQEKDIFKTSAPPDVPSNVGAIVGGVLGGLALVAVIGVIIFLARNYRKKSSNHSGPPIENETKGKEIIKKRPVRMRDFNDHVTKFHKDANLLFQDEFENIRDTSETFKNTCDEAKREQNRVKNRWADILPYDHSRVKLNISSDDDDTNDFINANYIPGYSSVREYIATQGPLYSTVPDFWKMIWEQKSKVIVMLSDLTESGKNGIPQRKVDLYWPENLNEPISYGTVVVEMTNFSQMNKYIIRNFRLIKGEEIRKVTHFFLPGWPDYSADIHFDTVLGFVKAIRQEITPESQGPIVVHCSAGVGRSGTFIALDYFTQFVEQHSMDDSIDVFEFVLRMRKNRTRMVQVETQYILIYDGINKLIQNKIKSEEEKLYENVNPANGIYENLKQEEENIYANTTIKDDKYVYNNEAFEPDFSHSQKSDKPTTEL